MMYLSRMVLNPRTRRVQREIANPYELHRTLMRSFPEELPESERVLFRIDVDPRTGVPTVLAQSVERPDWAWLGEPGAANYLLGAPESKAFDLAFAPGQRLAFRLRANPTVKRDGSRHGLYREEEQRAWIERKGERGGFRVRDARIVDEGNVTAWIPGADRRRKAVFYAVRFDGLLEVTDPHGFWETVRTGVGSAKGLGFGLLSVGPARG